MCYPTIGEPRNTTRIESSKTKHKVLLLSLEATLKLKVS